MLGKLMKYDIRSTWRDFTGIYLAILLGVIIVPIILNNAQSQILNMSAGLIAFFIVVAVIVVTIINLFKIFNTNVFSKEGYLTMTLPATSGQIITSKLLVSSMWIILTGLVSIAGIIIFTLIITGPNPFLEMFSYIRSFLAEIGSGQTAGLTFTIILFAVSVLVSTVKEISKLFLACSIAHLKQIRRFRVAAGILSYFVFTWLETIIVQAASFVVSVSSNHFEALLTRIDGITNPADIMPILGSFNLFIGASTIYTLLITVLFSFGTVWILNHKLDLD